MDQFSLWTEDLKTENEIIDSQHKILFDLINDLDRAFTNTTSPKIVDTLFTILTSYIFDHFELEENLISKNKDLLEHCYEHYQLIRAMHTHIHAFRNNRLEDIEPAAYLRTWLHKHIPTYDIPALCNFKPDTIGKLQLENDTELPIQEVYELDHSELRAFKRLPSDHVTNEKILGHCYNASKLKNSTVVIENLSTGGLNITDTHTDHDIGDLIVISCAIGTNFKMKEKLTVKNRNDNSYGLEFTTPSSETTEFLDQLYGSVKLSMHNPYH